MSVQQTQQERLFVVVDPRDETHHALERAVITSRLRNPPPQICVFVSCDDRKPSREVPETLHRNQEWFDKVINRPLSQLPVNHEISVSWGGSWPAALLSAAEAYGATMIVTPLHEQIPGQRMMLGKGKWDLLKNASCPVLLVRPDAPEKRRKVLAAVNFQATEDPLKELNMRILGHARRTANRYTADLHVVNAYRDTLHYPDRGNLAKESGLSANRIHVQQGYTDEVVSQVAQDIGADIVVIGTPSERGTGMKIPMGNTGSRLIAALDMDTLVVN